MNDTVVPRAALVWIVGDDTGMSSEAIWAHMVGAGGTYPVEPSDPDDIGRCFRLLELVPAWKERMPEMAHYSEAWKYLVENWDKIRDCMEAETGITRPFKARMAPRTYELMNAYRDHRGERRSG